jgi:hypothetical protein
VIITKAESGFRVFERRLAESSIFRRAFCFKGRSDPSYPFRGKGLPVGGVVRGTKIPL